MSGRRKAAGGSNGAAGAATAAAACRVIVHLDLDCYYAQVEQRRLNIPADQPVAVQQWGSLLAVNYVARQFGVLRGEHTSEALKKCPTLHVPHVDTLGENRRANEVFDRKHQKAILRRYRVASREIFAVLRRFAPLCEKAGIDEAFLDLTQQAQERLAQMDSVSSEFCSDPENQASKVFGISQMDGIGKDAERDELSGFPLTEEEQLLAVGATIAHEIREAVRKELQFTCSTGIATNKLLAKLVSPLNKPDGQTVIAPRFVPLLMQHFPLRKVRGFGGKLGKQLEDLLHKHKAPQPPSLPLSEKTTAAVATSAAATQEDKPVQDGVNDEVKKPKTTVHEFVEKFRFDELVKHLGYETATYVRQACSGDDGEDPVKDKKTEIKSLSSVKQFDQQSGDVLIRAEQLEYWVRVLCEEIILRCEDERVENKRFPLQLTMHSTRVGEKPKSRKLRIVQTTTVDELFAASMNLLRRDLHSIFPCACLSMNAKDFISLDSTSVASISNFFTKQAQPAVPNEEEGGSVESHSSDQHERKPHAEIATQRKSDYAFSMPSKRKKISSFFQATDNSSDDQLQEPRTSVNADSAAGSSDSAAVISIVAAQAAPGFAHPVVAAPSSPFDEVEDAFAQFRGEGSPSKGERATFYCDRCLRSITESRAEHDDFHFAVNLSRSENRAHAPPPLLPPPAAAAAAAGKKRKTGPLDAFLKR